MSLPSLRRWSKEPALHFAAIGLGLFLLHARVSPPERARVVVSAAFVDGLVQEQRERGGPPPSPAERAALIDRYVDEELLFREALALGLDRGDPIVRRRLVQKMELVGDGAAPLPEPSEAELQAWLDAHADRFREPPRTSFEHVFLSRDRRGESLADDARKLAAELRSGTEPSRAGDPFVQGRAFSRRSEQEIASVFGASFAASLASLPQGTWSDPIRSSFGEHLVRVEERREGHVASLASVRERVREEWVRDQREQRRAGVTRALRARYRVEIEGPSLPAAPVGSVDPGESLAKGRDR